ncbi:MAG: hypothetical protein GY862_22300 [Gammaproteobacteria bacterium]|nr:hypothetical protein [Gammaproteobacteria bacterium]
MKIFIKRVLLAAGILLAAGVIPNATAQILDAGPCDLNGDGEILGENEEKCAAGGPLDGGPCDLNGDGEILGENEEQCAAGGPLDGGPCDLNGDGEILGENEEKCAAGGPLDGGPCDLNGDGEILGENEEKCAAGGSGDGICDPNDPANNPDECPAGPVGGVCDPNDPAYNLDECSGGSAYDYDVCAPDELQCSPYHPCDTNHDGKLSLSEKAICIIDIIFFCDLNGDGLIMGENEELCEDTAAGIAPCDFNHDGHVDLAEKRECNQATEFDPCDFNLDGHVDSYEQWLCDKARDEDVALSDLVEQLPDELKDCINAAGELICSLERFIEACDEGIPATCKIVNYFLDPCDFNGNGELDEFEKGVCGGDESGTNACDFNEDKIVDEAEMEQCGDNPCRLDPHAPGCPLYCDANPNEADCDKFEGLPEYCKNPDILPECDPEENAYPARYCGMLPLPRELFPECHPWVPDDFGIDPAQMTGPDPWAKFHDDHNAYQALDEEDFGLIPREAFGNLVTIDMQRFDEDALAGMTLEQFMEMPDRMLKGLHAGNMGGLPWKVIRKMTRDELGHLGTREFHKMDGRDIGEFFVHFDRENIGYDDIQKHIPSGWQIDRDTGGIKPPKGTHVMLPEMGNRGSLAQHGLHLPRLPDFGGDFSLGGKAQSGGSFLEKINLALQGMGFGDFTFSQNDNGTLNIRGQEMNFCYLSDQDDVVQAGDDESANISLDEDGYPVMITSDHRQFALRPAPWNPDELRRHFGGEVHVGGAGDVLLEVPGFSVPFIFDAMVEPAPEGAEPGPYFDDPDGHVRYVYEDDTAQKIYPAPYQPDNFERALASADIKGVTDLRFKANGTITGKYYGKGFVLRPTWNTEVGPEGTDTLYPNLGVKKTNADGSFELKYQVRLPEQAESNDRILTQFYDGDWE